MNTHVKRAVISGGAAVLLLGGAGSLAYWNSQDTTPGATLSSGRLLLDASDCDTAGWTVSNQVEGVSAAAFDPAAEQLVPGDAVSKVCTIAVEADGTNLRSTLGITGLQVSGALAAAGVEFDGGFTRGGQEIDFGQPVVLEDGDELQATISVGLPLKAGEVDNTSMSKSLDISDVTFTATQATS